MEINTKDKLETGVAQGTKYKWGIIGGLILGMLYVLFLTIRYRFLDNSFKLYESSRFVAYILILGGYFLLGLKSDAEIGEKGQTRDIFSTLFLAALITEAFYIIYNFLYLKYIDPGMGAHHLELIKGYMTQQGVDQGLMKERMSKVATENEEIISNFGLNFKSWISFIIIDGIICLIFAVIIKKPFKNFRRN